VDFAEGFVAPFDGNLGYRISHPVGQPKVLDVEGPSPGANESEDESGRISVVNFQSTVGVMDAGEDRPMDDAVVDLAQIVPQRWLRDLDDRARHPSRCVRQAPVRLATSPVAPVTKTVRSDQYAIFIPKPSKAPSKSAKARSILGIREKCPWIGSIRRGERPLVDHRKPIVEEVRVQECIRRRRDS